MCLILLLVSFRNLIVDWLGQLSYFSLEWCIIFIVSEISCYGIANPSSSSHFSKWGFSHFFHDFFVSWADLQLVSPSFFSSFANLKYSFFFSFYYSTVSTLSFFLSTCHLPGGKKELFQVAQTSIERSILNFMKG